LAVGRSALLGAAHAPEPRRLTLEDLLSVEPAGESRAFAGRQDVVAIVSRDGQIALLPARSAAGPSR
jgi:hypothetical protein